MERVSTAVPTIVDRACVGCSTPLEGTRCNHCGAAAQAGRYTIQRIISQSLHARIYLAEDERGAKVALKELLYSFVPSIEDLESFERESRLLQELSHDRIPRFVAGFTEGSGAHTRLYLAQQFVSGESLEQRLEHHRFSEDEVQGLAEQVLQILAWLHHRSPPVVHRNVKPSNLILSPDGVLYLVDFGSARAVRGTQTFRSTLVGTIGYMAPEQMGGTVGPRSDLYSLGATLVRILTRQPPEELIGNGMAIDVERLKTSSEMRTFLSGLLAPRPVERFATAEAALVALRNPAAARRPPTRRRVLSLGMTLAAASAMLAAAALLTTRSRGSVSAPVEEIKQVAALTVPAERDPIAETGDESSAERPTAATRTQKSEGELTGVPEQPVVTKSAMPWELVKWEFRNPGPWLLDATGHHHSVLLPTSGYSVDFFGQVWSGSQKIRVPDSPDFAVAGPFNLNVSIRRVETTVDADSKRHTQISPPIVATEHIFTRGDPNGRFALDLSLIAPDKIQFTVSDRNGRSSRIEGTLSLEGSTESLVAQLDPQTGEQSILRLGNCKPLAQTHTQIIPASHVDDRTVHLLEGYRGGINSIELSRGIEVIGSPDARGSCGWQGAKLESPPRARTGSKR